MRNKSARIGAVLARRKSIGSRRARLLAVGLALFTRGALADDTVFLKKGAPVHGAILDENPKTGVRIKLANGTTKTFAAALVDHVEYEPPPPDPTPPPPPPPAVEAPAVVAPVKEPEAPAGTWKDEFDVTEKEGKRYYFLGLRYRGAIIPQAFMNIFVSGGATVFSNSAGLELDIRKDGFSLIPNLTYTEYSTGNLLFLQHGQPDSDPGNWSMVNSGIKVLYLGTDLLWSVHIAKNFDFEYGLGFGIGVVFGSLIDNWVTPTNNPNATVTINGQTYGALNGNSIPGYKGYFLPCASTSSGPGCSPADHQNATTAKVGGFAEPHGFNPIPTLFMNVSIPQIGVRIKPMKSVEGRLGVAFNIPNGFWFGFSGDYGLEKLLEKK